MKERILQAIRDWTLNHFFITFIVLVIINVFFLANNNVSALLKIIAFLLLIVYIIVFIITRIKSNITKLIHHELKFNQIMTAYVVSVIFIILLFSIIYWAMMLVGAGYLKYGSCIGNAEFTLEDIAQDPLTVIDPTHYSYFSAITFFSVGYGDICPMGINKVIATINAIIGNAFTVLILAMAITNYSTSKSEERKKKR
jgi:potassium channel LctB